MELRLTAHRIELTEELRRFVERRARFGMGRIGERIRSMAIRLKDVNGPRGGVDQSCDVEVDLGLEKPVIVRERRENVFSAIAIALERAGRAARRRLAVEREPRRESARVRPAPTRERREKVLAALGLAVERAAQEAILARQ